MSLQMIAVFRDRRIDHRPVADQTLIDDPRRSGGSSHAASLATPQKNCALCGNERSHDKIGKKCRSLIATFPRPYSFWKEASERYGQSCCYGVVRGGGFLFQASNWKQCPLTIFGKPRVRRGSASIEMGVMFNQEDDEMGQVKTFYGHPQNNGCLVTYGPALSYPKDVKNRKFWRKIEIQLGGVAQAVFDDYQSEYRKVLRCLNHSLAPRLTRKRRIT